ncbi:ycfU [Wigglesworthia glossinidia endosymbiont of Glossina brevipalpis]|uniref:YcfU protein n=1 Tax=Wigglesworthia glossinidia brevipalpis TaxID=36870 RepID=Q8D3A1_WIGBR|nr:ycfU [Wigglesworthia glossinidia endosymbiont of Glossina brevipalpis]
MYKPVFLYIGIRYIICNSFNKYNKFTSWISFLSIVIGTSSLILITSVIQGFELDLEKYMLKFIPHVILYSNDNFYEKKNRIKYELNKNCSEINQVSEFISTNVIIQSNYNLNYGNVFGVNIEDEDQFLNSIGKKKIEKLLPDQYGIILGYELAKSLNVYKNSKIRMIFIEKNNFTILGPVPTQRVFTVIDIFHTNSEVDQYQILMNKKDLKKIMKNNFEYKYNWRLWLKHPLEINKSCIISCFPGNYNYKDWREDKGDLFNAINIEKNVMFLFLSLIIILSIFNIFISISIEIIQKKKEIAILKTYGFNKISIFFTFIIYGSLISIIGTIIGTILGVFISSNLNNILFKLNIINDFIFFPKINYFYIFKINLFFIIFTIISIIYPSYKAVMINSSKTLKYE